MFTSIPVLYIFVDKISLGFTGVIPQIYILRHLPRGGTPVSRTTSCAHKKTVGNGYYFFLENACFFYNKVKNGYLYGCGLKKWVSFYRWKWQTYGWYFCSLCAHDVVLDTWVPPHPSAPPPVWHLPTLLVVKYYLHCICSNVCHMSSFMYTYTVISNGIWSSETYSFQ